ncbi:ADP-ribose glycohydrolase MACROD1-like isoform X3 [Hyla sarda]|uniref:ADP-ribose glycohydrolase MACROD1-like isoform X3 n=1 Tax=Hyla sarda TaxID=327740 RepID=UPI0024C3DD93|nr:ADP-ribose glycohydrolase MACROD1-like isoform X3 [Hyla sarda]
MSGLGLTLRGLLPLLGRYSSQRAAAPVLHVARGVPFTSYWATADRFTTGLLTSSTRAMSGKIDLYSPSTSWKEAKTFLKGLNNKQRREHYSVKDFIKLKEIPAWKDTAKKAQAKQPEEVKFPKSKDLNEKISLVRGDITKLEVDAIVNADPCILWTTLDLVDCLDDQHFFLSVLC